jgi:deoxyribose-phosphate aldolase
LLRVKAVGVDRVGATATGVILDETVRRGISAVRVEVEVPPFLIEHGGGGY